MEYNHVWSEIDEKIVPVDPADCEDCKGIAPNPCITHYILGATFTDE